MFNSHDDLINSTVTSSKNDLIGSYYYDSLKKAFYKVINSRKLYVSFEYNFECRWSRNHHIILESKKASHYWQEKLLTCPKSEYVKLTA